MVQSLEASLKRLNTDYIDLYWVHAWDPMTPIEEMMHALDDMIKSGKILYAGISDAPAWVVSQANTLANLRGWTEFIGIQIEYSLIERTSERELLPMASALDVGVTAWSPLGGGVLTGKYGRRRKNKDQQHNIDNDTKKTLSKEEGSRLNVVASSEMSNVLLKDRNLIIAEEVSRISNDVGHTQAQVALNWVRQQKLPRQQQRQSKIIPIIGARNTSQIKDNLACLEFELSEDQMQRLNEVSKIELGFPHDFLAANFIKDIIYGGTYSSIYDHRA
jgi:aryl-alcohol dehydrogenase-like predicted oxidoreductase